MFRRVGRQNNSNLELLDATLWMMEIEHDAAAVVEGKKSLLQNVWRDDWTGVPRLFTSGVWLELC